MNQRSKVVRLLAPLATSTIFMVTMSVFGPLHLFANSTPASAALSDALWTAETPAGQVAQSMRIDGLVVLLTLTPGQAGYNEINLMYFDAGAGGRSPLVRSFEFFYLDYDSVRFEATPSESHVGHAVLAGEHFRHAGRWRLTAVIQNDGREDTLAMFEVAIGPSRE